MAWIKSFNKVFWGMAALSVLISGCSFFEKPGNNAVFPPPGVEEENRGDSELFRDVKIIKFMAGMSGSASMRAAEDFSKRVGEKAGGKLRVELFKTGDLGNQKDIMEGVSRGTIEMAILPPIRFQTLEPAFSVFDQLSWLYGDIRQVEGFMKTDEFKEKKGLLNNSFGIKIMGVYSSGQRHIWTGRKQVVLPDDLKNLKIRVSEQDNNISPMSSQVLVYKALGAVPLYMPLSDVTAGIRSGVIDGMDGNAADIINNNLIQVIRYCVLTNHSNTIMMPVFSKKAWDGLEQGQQNILLEEIDAYVANVRDIIWAEDSEYLLKLKEQGIVFTELTEEQKRQYKEIIEGEIEKQARVEGINIRALDKR